jgi:ATP-dependent Clp protease ATP-binding subunit ClpC
VTQDDSAASLDLAIGWLGRRIADLAATPAAGRAPIAGSSTPAAAGTAPSAATLSGASPSFAASASATPSAAASATPSASTVPGPAGSPARVPARATPFLDQVGRDLTALAAQGLLDPAIGRDAETARLIEALCRPTRPSAVLLGPDGIGKAGQAVAVPSSISAPSAGIWA